MWCFSRESATSPLPISWELDKLKEPTKDNLTRHNTANSGLQFLDIPLGDDLKIRDLQLENQFVLFEAFSKLTGYLLPSQFPIGLLNETLGGKQPLHFWVLQILKWEIPVVVWIIFWAMLALCFPLGVLVSLCCSPDGDGNCGETKGRWTETTLSSLLYLLLILLLCPLALILASNEQIAKTIGQSPALAALLYGDIGRFIRNSHMQISFVATSSTDIALEAIRQDLEDIGRYVGAPYQQQLCKETGLDRALIGLEDLKAETARVSSIVSDLLAASDSAKRAGDTLQDEMQEIARQLVSIQQQCDAKDRALCFAVQFPGYDTTIALENITNDAKIHQLERLTKDSSFNASIDFARRIYHNIPEQMAEESSQFVAGLMHVLAAEQLFSISFHHFSADIKSLLSRKRAQIYKSTHDLDMFARTMSQKVNGSRKAIFTQLENVVKWDLWRWMAILAIAALLALTWGCLITGAPRGCGTRFRAGPCLKIGLILSCLSCWVLWALGGAALLAGGNGESLICQPLHDHPYYEFLSKLARSGGVFQANDSIDLASVLKSCQRDLSAYETFRLHTRLDLDAFNHKTWRNFTKILDQFASTAPSLELLSPELQENLQTLASTTAANLSSYRQQLSGKERDLGPFAEQLNNIARQLLDPLVSRKFDYLAFSVRNIVQNSVQRLNGLRGNILYKITMLEVLQPPLNGCLHRSLSHLKTVQFFLDNQAWTISERAKRQFTARLKNYLEQLHDHVAGKVAKEIGKCRPLWAIFHASRFHVCKLMFDPVNAIAFGCHLLILILMAFGPIVVKLLRLTPVQGRQSSRLAHRDSRQGLILQEEPIWTTPSSESPQALEMTREAPTTWLSPPPRPPSIEASKLSALASRITGTRNSPLASLSTARTPRRAQPSQELGASTPRRWI
ncbi:hypothetical protein HUJ05_002359 [Dendroctonus ponderosae]|nr:hypothetical protein HUJ05_002359 [Dendroctonus ponderosae]